MFISKDLKCESLKPQQALDYIFYINGNQDDRYITKTALIDTLKRLNPRFADFINR